MENLSMYKFIAKIALEYRLSLENICKLMKKEPTETNKNMVYELIINSCAQKSKIVHSYKYLLNYETINEKEEVSSKAFKAAQLFIMQYNDARKRNDDAMINFVMRKLTKTDRDFQAIMKKDLSEPLTEEDATIIAKYRVKYCISKETMASILNIGEGKIRLGESKIQDEILKAKANLVSEYQESLELGKRSKKH